MWFSLATVQELNCNIVICSSRVYSECEESNLKTVVMFDIFILFMEMADDRVFELLFYLVEYSGVHGRKQSGSHMAIID
jgi:hypothetical protein